MQALKLEITDNSSKLRKVVAKVFSRDLPSVGGNNYFTGELSNDFSGQFGMTADDQKSWDYLWRIMGAAAPGELPEGAKAVFFADDNKKGQHSSVSLEAVTKKNGKIDLAYEVTYTPVAEGEKQRGSFSVILLPKGAEVSSAYNYKIETNISAPVVNKADVPAAKPKNQGL